MDKKFEPLSVGEVLSIEESVQILIGHRTFRVGELAEAIRRQLENGVSGWTQDKNAWFSEDGVSCEVLQFNARGWQKGKVKINLVFCPDESSDEGKPASASSKESETLAADSKDELNLEVSSTSMDDELNLEVSSTSMDDELNLEVSSTTIDDELDLEVSSTSMDDEVDLEVSSTTIDDELDLDDDLDLDDSSSSMDDDEFELGFSEVAHEEQKQEAPTEIYSEMEREAAMISADGIDFDDVSDDLDDEFDEISQSIEDELEEEEDLTDGEDELLDLGEISTDSDDDLDFGEISDSDDDEFELTDLSSNDDSDDNGTESLLDDVWQDMNKATW